MGTIYCCLHAYARSIDVDSKLKGYSLIIDGVRYKYEDIDKLPHDLSLENAKIIEVQDGFAFQSRRVQSNIQKPGFNQPRTCPERIKLGDASH